MKEKKEVEKKRSMRDLTNLEILKLLDRFNVSYSIKIDDDDDRLYTIFVRKESVKNEMQLIVLKRLHFGTGKEAYIKALKQGMTPFEYVVERAETFKLEHPDYVSRKSIANSHQDDEPEPSETIDSEDIPF